MPPLVRQHHLAFILLVLLIAPACLGQQQVSAVNNLKEQIELLARIDRDPATTLDVKIINRDFLKKHRSELDSLLRKRIGALRNYRSTNSFLNPDEAQKIEAAIGKLEVELQDLEKDMQGAAVDDGTTNQSVEAVERETGQPALNNHAGAFQTICPANADALISQSYVRSPPGAPTILYVELSAPLSITQDSPVTLVPPGVPANVAQVHIPQELIVITTQHGTTSKTFLPNEYSPAETDPGSGRQTLKITITGNIPADDTGVKVRLINLKYDCSTAAGVAPTPTIFAAANNTGLILTEKAFNDRITKEYDKAIAAAKSPDRKAFSAGFAAAKGDGGKAQGAGDFLINKTFSKEDLKNTILNSFDQTSLSLQVKKSSAEKVDPRYFNLGLTFRKTYLIFTPARPTPLTVANNTPQQVHTDAQTAEAQIKHARNEGFLRVLAVSGGVKLEGEAFDFKTVNFVADPSVEIGSIAKRLGSKGYYNMSFIAGPELGRNMSKPDASTMTVSNAALLDQVNWIVRFASGGQMTLRYLPTSNSGAHWGVEMNLAYVNRHLFNNEVFTEVVQKDGKDSTKVSTIGQGNRAWRQADLKIFLFGDEKARYGFKVSYMNGQLPPAFTPTKGLQYGFVMETSDDKTSGDAANQ